LTVSKVMSHGVVTVSPGESAAFASRLLSRHNLGALPVCENGRLSGVLTDRDIVLRCVAAGHDPETVSAGEIMSRQPVTAAPEDSLQQAAELMARAQVRRLPVLKDGAVVGMVSLGDIAKARGPGVAGALEKISENIRRL